MKTSAQTPDPLADRLFAMWKRRTARFRDAYYAHQLAVAHSEQVGRSHPTYKQARELVRRARRRMEIIHKQTRRLAVAQTRLILA